MYNEPATPKDQIPSLSEFKKLDLNGMLQAIPLLQVGDSDYSHKPQMYIIICVDGTRLSVQANRFMHCYPADNTGPYTHVEVGYPSIVPPVSWKKYCEDWSNPTGTVYSYIPIKMVLKFIAEHGGMNLEKMFAEKPYPPILR